MDLRRTLSDFVNQAKELSRRLHSSEARTLTAIDLLVLRAQLHLLNNDVVSLQDCQKVQSKKPDAA